jgi:hypothetical protein
MKAHKREACYSIGNEELESLEKPKSSQKNKKLEYSSIELRQQSERPFQEVSAVSLFFRFRTMEIDLDRQWLLKTE